MSDFLRKNKVYVIVIGLLILYLVIFGVVSSVLNNENKKYANIIIDGVNIWEYKESNWNVLTQDELSDKDVIYKVYSTDGYYGDYTVKVNNRKLYAFDDDYNSLDFSGPVLAINSNYDINVYYYSLDDVLVEDNNILASVIDNSYDYIIRKILVDVNNDEEYEYIYIVDYYNGNEVIFNEIYYYNGKLREIIKNDGSRYINYNVDYILDINNDNKYEIIVSSKYHNIVSYKIYKLDGKNFDLFLE